MDRLWTLDNNFNFTYSISNLDQITTNNYIEAINKIRDIVCRDAENFNLNKFAVCLSGIDSELILKSFYEVGKTVECFFLLIKEVNEPHLKLCQKIVKKYNSNLSIVEITKNDLLDFHIFRNFLITKVCWPTYVSIPSLIEQIPSDYFIILGEGDLEKDNTFRYGKIFNQKIQNIDPSMFYIPIHLTEIAYQQSLSYFGKKGESNFFSRSFDSWYHILNDPDLETDKKIYYNPKIKILNKISNNKYLISPTKTLNFEDTELSNKIIKLLLHFGNNIKNWNPFIGDILSLPESFLN